MTKWILTKMPYSKSINTLLYSSINNNGGCVKSGTPSFLLHGQESQSRPVLLTIYRISPNNMELSKKMFTFAITKGDSENEKIFFRLK